MKAKAIFLIALLVSVTALTGVAQKGWLTYKGAYFDIKYPAGFRARPSQRTDGERYDSVFFTAPDSSVEFYVFSPIWNGDPADIEINQATEDYVSQDTQTNRGIKIRRVTIRAKDGSYLRSFEDTENTNTNNRTVFGIKYRDQSAYNRHRQTYLTFKKSIRQFAD
ncbi:MAG TPA: hypothetical protein VJS44_00385 [Pyrinomonadaceae bacterium]|nr:hypothetical protein [Pyrinomonadaceae bacterium]